MEGREQRMESFFNGKEYVNLVGWLDTAEGNGTHSQMGCLWGLSFPR